MSRSIQVIVVLLIIGVAGYFMLPERPAKEMAEPIDYDQLEAMLETAPQRPAAPLAGAQNHASMDAAIARLEDRLRADPTDVSGWVLLARSHMSVGNNNAAIEAFEAGLAHLPDNVELLLYYGESLMAIGGEGPLSDDAKAAFARALAVQPDHPGARYYQALGVYLDGDVAKARGLWQAMADSAPEGAPWLPTVQGMLDRISGNATQ